MDYNQVIEPLSIWPRIMVVKHGVGRIRELVISLIDPRRSPVGHTWSTFTWTFMGSLCVIFLAWIKGRLGLPLEELIIAWLLFERGRDRR